MGSRWLDVLAAAHTPTCLFEHTLFFSSARAAKSPARYVLTRSWFGRTWGDSQACALKTPANSLSEPLLHRLASPMLR
jgi:hypothetical protein